jgi:4-amino-4-deoxy-L-arabinose transferase-like glycosyltransferase
LRRRFTGVFSQDSRKRKVICLLAILAATYVFFFYNLGGYSLKEPDEGRYAEIPREMVETGDYMVPHLDYVRYFEKPPLLYWMTALSFKAFGANEWSFRIPNALAALLCVVITYLFAARWFGDKIALLSSLMLISSFGFFAMAHIVTIDMLFAVLLFISLLCFYEFYHQEKALFLYLFFAILALAVLAKGPVALILLGATILLFLLTERKISFLKKMASVKGILLFFLIAAPWFIVISLREKEFFHFFFIDQHILRFLTTKHRRSGPVYYFIPVLLGGLFPWSIFLPRAVIRLWRVKELRLFFIWSAVVFAFFSLSGSKLPPYILPVFPALSIILGYLFESEWQQRVNKNWEIIVYSVFFCCVALAGLAYRIGALDEYLSSMPDIASVVRDARGLLFGLSITSLVTLIILAFKKMRTYSTLFLVLGGFSLAVVTGLMLHAHVIDGLNTTKALAQRINASKTASSIIVDYGSIDQTLPFYTRGRTYLASSTGELEMGSKYPDAKGFFLNEDEMARLFRSDKDVWVVFKAKRLARLKELGIQPSDVFICQDQRCVIGNGNYRRAKQDQPS